MTIINEKKNQSNYLNGICNKQSRTCNEGSCEYGKILKQVLTNSDTSVKDGNWDIKE